MLGSTEMSAITVNGQKHHDMQSMDDYIRLTWHVSHEHISVQILLLICPNLRD